MAYRVLIEGIERTSDILSDSIVADDIVNDQTNSLSFAMINRSMLGFPEEDDDIQIILDDDSKLFGGMVLRVDLEKRTFGEVTARVRCSDYTRILDRNLAHVSYNSTLDGDIIDDLITRYCSGFGITTNNVVPGITLDQLTFNYVQISQALRKLAKLTARNWFIDYDKDIHFYPINETSTPFNITASGNQFENLRISKDASQIKNRVYVRGGTQLSDFFHYFEKGDGEKTTFVIPDKPHDVSIEVNGSPQTLGIKNIDTSGYDWYLNFQEKYVEQDSGGAVLTDSDVLEVIYKYDIPILVAQEATDSIEAHGVHEFPIFDKTISTTTAARDRAIAELTDYGNSIIEGSFETWTPGFHSGQTININHSAYGVNDDYVVQKVQARSMGGGQFKYTVSIASAKTTGIIRFLIELLENNRNLIELDPNEVVDELFMISDALISDSLTDSLIDSLGAPPYKWSNAPGTTTNKLRWNLGEWD